MMAQANGAGLPRTETDPEHAAPPRVLAARWLFRGLTALFLGLSVGLLGGGRASADTITNSGDIMIEVGETATISWTFADNGTDPNLCDGDGGTVFAVYFVSGQAGVTYVDPNGTQDTVNTPFIATQTPCVAGSSTQSFQVTGTSPGTRIFGVYRANANVGTGDNNASSSLTVTVVPPNAAPVAAPQSVSTAEDTALPILLSATDADGDSLSYAYTQPAHGTVTGTGPSVTYQPTPEYSGPDSFTFTASDGIATSASATVTITVTAVNDRPVVAALPNLTVDATGPAGAVVTFPTPTATDVEDGPLTVSCAPASGATFPVGVTTVTCSATDSGSSTGTSRFTVTVRDTSGPVIAWVGGPQPNRTYTQATLPAEPTCTATDAFSDVTQCRVYGYSTAIGTHTLTARARDTAGNSSVSTRTYTVTGTIAPTATPVTPRPTATPTRPPRPTTAPVQPTATPVLPTVPPTQPTATPTRPPRR